MKRITRLCLYLAITVLAAMFAGCGDDDNGFFFIPVTGLSISPATLPDGAVGAPYSQTLTATGGTAPYRWSLATGSTLPPLLGLDPVTGVLSGNPTVAATFSFTVTVEDSAATPLKGSRTYTMTIQPSSVLTITTTTLPDATLNTAYTPQTLAATGGTQPYSWSLEVGSTLPPGLSLSTAGVISGTPTAEGPFNFTVRVTDAVAAFDTQALSITVLPAGVTPLTITTTTLPDAVFNTLYPDQQLNATGGTPPYTWSVPPLTLPNGLTLSAAGILSGTPIPMGSGPFTFTVTVTDNAANTDTQLLSLTVTVPVALQPGKTIYDGQCAGCHSLGAYDTTTGSGPELSPVSLATFNAIFSTGIHAGDLTATQMTDVFAFIDPF